MTVLRVGAAPEVFRGEGQYFDGVRPVAQTVMLEVEETQGLLDIVFEDGAIVSWPLEDLRRLKDQGQSDALILRPRGDSTARLIVEDAEEKAVLRGRARRLNAAVPFPRKWRIAVWATGAVASVAMMIFVLIPLMADQLAEIIPPAGEKALGDTTLEQVRFALNTGGLEPLPFCETPNGLAALGTMQERLQSNTQGAPAISLHVLDHEMVNAFALPGGHVILFRGLIEAAEEPEQVAAVLAHEIGHVAARDPTRIALRSAGSIGVLGLLFGDFAGGALMLVLANQMIQANYTQEAEAAADTYAHAMMLNAGASPEALGTFFELLAETSGLTEEDEDSILAHFASHPELGDRSEAARAAVPEGVRFEKLLSDEAWRDLQQICDS